MSDQITYNDKADLIVDTTIDDKFKVSASDMNEIKNVVNSHADDIDVANNNITDLNNNKLDINAVLNQASTDTDKPYSADYLNDKLVSVGTTAPTDGREVWFKTIDNSIVVNNQEWFNPNNVEKYSTNETKIGTWTDGKPIYRSVFDISTISSSNANLVDLNNLNIKLVINLYGTIKDTYNYEYPIPMSDSSSNYNVVFYNGRYIRGRCLIGSGASIAIAKVILEYTKPQIKE